MNQFEHELRQALERREAPLGFAERVLARVPAQRARRKWLPGWLTANHWSPAFAAGLILMLAVGSWEYRETEQRRQGERTKQELILALQVTSHKLQATKTKLLQNMGGRL